jgi:hypothetical protein
MDLAHVKQICHHLASQQAQNHAKRMRIGGDINKTSYLLIFGNISIISDPSGLLLTRVRWVWILVHVGLWVFPWYLQEYSCHLN